MTAHPRAKPHFTPNSGLAQTLYFNSEGKSLFGWLHHPAARAASRIGLVICNPFGYEATCAHRSVRAFAESVAHLGVPTLRFDYLGTGDSEDINPNQNQLTTWRNDILAAIAELQRQTGVEKVCLLGIRFGGLLAALAGAHCAAVSSLILIAPIVNGSRYLREIRVTRLAANMATERGSANDAGADRQSAIDGSIEISGFSMSAATVASLAEVDLAAQKTPPALDILIIDGEKLPTSAGWVESLTDRPGRVTYMALPGLVEMCMRSPLRAMVPGEMVHAVTEWLGRRIEELPPPPSAAPKAIEHVELSAAMDATNSVLVMKSDAFARPSVIAERPVFIASGAMLFGVVTEPQHNERRHRGVILLNTGADNHIGANRMHVSLARRWAHHGYVVLRLDLGGLGDSATRAGRQPDDVFPPDAIEDIRTAIDFLRGHFGVDNLSLVGVCSGAYHALRAAAAKLPVNQIFMINPQNYFWKEGMRIDELQLAEVVRNPTTYLNRLFSPHAWQRLFSGDVSLVKIIHVYLHRSFLAIESTVREVARRLRVKLPQDLGSELEEIGSRGVRVAFVFARDEPGIELLKLQGGSSVQRLGDLCRVHIFEGGDHIFSQRAHRSVMEDALTNDLLTRFQPLGANETERSLKQT
jgi:pimeloyl-ACP methyl ester carboxylesterase